MEENEDREDDEGNKQIFLSMDLSSLVSGLLLGASLTLLGLAVYDAKVRKPKIQEEISAYEARIAEDKKSITALKERGDNLVEAIKKERDTRARRDVALTLLRRFSHDELADESVLDRYKNDYFPGTDAEVELRDIIEQTRSGYLENILLHQIKPKETLTGISKQYCVPVEVIRNFNAALFNNSVDSWVKTTVRGMTDIREHGSLIQAGSYIAIPVYRQPKAQAEKPAETTAETPEE